MENHRKQDLPKTEGHRFESKSFQNKNLSYPI